MDLNGAKWIALVLFFLVPIALGSLSMYLYTRYRLTLSNARQGKGFLSYLNCFAGGFFLGTCLLVVLGQGIAKFEEYRHMVNLQYTFPFFEVGIGAGFFLVALTEKLAHLAFGAHKPPGRDDYTEQEKVKILEMTPRRTSSNIPIESDDDLYEVPDGLDTASIVPKSDTKYQSIQDPGQQHTESDRGSQSSSSAISSRHDQNRNQNERRGVRQSPFAINKPEPVAKNTSDVTNNNSGAAENNTGNTRSVESEGTGGGSGCAGSGSSVSLLRVMLLVLALSFHTVFDGLTLGLQDDVNEVITLLVVISIHKAIMALALGVELATVFFNDARPCGPLRPFLALLLFALASPLGVAIGMGVTSVHVHRSAQLLAGTVLQAVSTGVFLYVTCFEVLSRDMAERQDRAVLRVLTAVLGFMVITALQTFTS